MLDFSSTAYLALDRHPRFREWVAAGFDRYGTHYGGSRRSPSAPDIFAVAERQLAQWLGTEEALLVSSGSLAAAWVRDHLLAAGWVLDFAPVVHVAWGRDSLAETGQRPPLLRNEPATGQRIALLADSVDPIAVAQAEWSSRLNTLDRDEDSCVLDESHAIGILGPKGSGLAPGYRQRWGGEVLAVGSLGKALSLPAGFIAGSHRLLDPLRSSPRFGGAAPPNAAFIYAYTQAADLIETQRVTLRERLAYFLDRLAPDFPVQTIPEHPALRCRLPGFYAFAQREGIHLSHFAYPSARDEPVTRIVLNAAMTYAQLDALLGVVTRFVNP